MEAASEVSAGNHGSWGRFEAGTSRSRLRTVGKASQLVDVSLLSHSMELDTAYGFCRPQSRIWLETGSNSATGLSSSCPGCRTYFPGSFTTPRPHTLGVRSFIDSTSQGRSPSRWTEARSRAGVWTSTGWSRKQTRGSELFLSTICSPLIKRAS